MAGRKSRVTDFNTMLNVCGLKKARCKPIHNAVLTGNYIRLGNKQYTFRFCFLCFDRTVTQYLYYLVLESDFQVMLLQVPLAKMRVAALTCTTEQVLGDILIC